MRLKAQETVRQLEIMNNQKNNNEFNFDQLDDQDNGYEGNDIVNDNSQFGRQTTFY